MNIFMLMMGGVGSRFGADRPKQYVEIEGKPVFSCIVEACCKAKFIDKIVIVSNAAWLDYVEEHVESLKKSNDITVVSGGENRSESVKNGLLSIRDAAKENDVVLIHDATHPYFFEEAIKKLIDVVNECGAGTLVQKQYDTVYKIDEDGCVESVIPREFVVSGASPEAFKYGHISKIYFNASDSELAAMTSAGAIALAHGISMKAVDMDGLNVKITYPQDMELFKVLRRTYYFKGDC